jgi:hypothetical protein
MVQRFFALPRLNEPLQGRSGAASKMLNGMCELLFRTLPRYLEVSDRDPNSSYFIELKLGAGVASVRN